MPHEKPSFELLAEGDIHYQDRRFQHAITSYIEAFESSNDLNDVTPLDKAAVCYLRTKDYNSALALTKKMSKINAGDVRVYLRMGQALQMLQKSALATKIFAKGLQRCRPTAEGYDTLRKQYSLLEFQERATKRIDPVDVLPHEILDEIMSSLDFRCRVNLLRVSKKWHSYLTSNYRLWTDLDLSSSRRPVSRNCIKNYIKWAKGRMHTATLNRLGNFRSFWELGRQCQISSLSLMYSDVSGFSITHPLLAFRSLQSLSITHIIVTLRVVDVILNQVPTLTSLNIERLDPYGRAPTWQGPYPNLQHLRVRHYESNGPSDYSRASLLGLLEMIPNIRILALNDWGSVRSHELDCSQFLHLESLVLQGSTVFDLAPKLPKSIRTLHMATSCAEMVFQEPTTLPNLESLALKITVPAQEIFENLDLFLPSLLDHYSSLRRFALTPSPSLAQWQRLILTPRLKRLEEIDMINIPDADEEQVCRLILDSLPFLRRLKMEEFRVLTGWGVKQLVNGLENLEQLEIVRCPKLQFDSIEWARKKVCCVKWTPLQEGSGRKLRGAS